ncbi:LOW QUALITY PROTEIN: zinc finger protein 703-like [Cottoperca gobio]|uniref:LOW QUALITY PROTEIN: zinc finger protein 703-like n=1 Tax=Cottoperca gobio TaxID=56716 RepID=A0A6J2QDK2_COTGO|nr:LOW QUALITY PROTEIN: zinc finger protein 703-like [Cottoperca gobio]
MRDPPGGPEPLLRRQSPERSAASSDHHRTGAERPCVLPASCPPTDPLRQAKRLPIRIVKMLTAHSGHLLHPEYLQPLTSAPVSIELDAKKSPLALLAQTCSQIGKPDPPSSSKLASISSGSLGDKESSSRSSKSGEHHQSQDDKSSFKPYSKSSGDCRKDALATKGPSDKAAFRVPNGSSSSGAASCPSFPPHSRSPSSSPPPLHSQSQPHRQSHSPSTQPPSHAQAPHTDNKHGSSEQSSSDSNSCNAGKKDSDAAKSGMDGAQLANSSHVRASANSSNASSASSPRPESKAEPQASSQPGLGSGHIAPVSPFKQGHSVFPLPPASMGYHGSIVGAYAGYPSQFVSGLDHKSSLGLGLPGKHPSSSPLTGASPPSLMQGLCRDPYCLTYPNAPHLGGSNCSTCVHDPSSLKSGYPLVYPSHHLHSLHPGALSSSAAATMSHPLYTYGFMLPNEPQPHACNWVSVGGPCDKRFATSEELLAHLRTHTALHGMVDSKLLSAYPSSVSSTASCHLHLPQSSPGTLPGSFSLRGSPGLSLARYHPYSKSHLAGAPGLPMASIPSSAYYSPYALYSQRLGSASALGYQ